MKSFFWGLSILLFIVATNAYSKDVKIAIGLALPPYVLTESNTGIELDIVKEALAYKGHTVTPEYVPFARVLKNFKLGKVDGAMTTNEASGLEDAFYSDSHVTYQNVAVSLKQNNITVSSINDLKTGVIIGFQNAVKYLGSEYQAAVQSNPRYTEMAEQDKQVMLLFKKNRAEILIMDINIFKYFRNNLKDVDTSPEVVYHTIFPKTDYKVAFKDSTLKDDFNEGLTHLKSTHRYQQIIDSYIK